MIKAVLYKAAGGSVTGFDIDNHGLRIVCAAVSVLSLNTINAIEALTDARFECDAEAEGHLRFRLTDTENSDAELLLKALELGFIGISQEYPKAIKLSVKQF